MYPPEQSEHMIAKGIKSAVEWTDGDSSEDSAKEDKAALPQQSGILQELVHTALQIRVDLENTPGHSAAWGIDQIMLSLTQSTCFFQCCLGVCRLSVQKKKPVRTQRQECVALHKTLCLGRLELKRCHQNTLD